MDFQAMQAQWQAEALSTDIVDLLELIALRFGEVPADVKATITKLTDLDALARLILVAANAATWADFERELKESGTAFRIAGEQFHPI